MIRPTLFAIRRDGPGSLSTMARPRGGDELGAQITALTAAGVTVLVSLLTDREVRELDLDAESTYALGAGLQFYRLPTPDLQVPQRAATVELARILAGQLQSGAGVAIHCRAGVGRASSLAAAVLVLEGLAPQEAWARISAARGLPVPDTPEQRAFVHDLLG